MSPLFRFILMGIPTTLALITVIAFLASVDDARPFTTHWITALRGAGIFLLIVGLAGSAILGFLTGWGWALWGHWHLPWNWPS